MPDDFTLRTIRDDDLPAVVALLNQSTSTTHEATTRAYARIRAQDNFTIRIAESRAAIVGTYGLPPWTTWATTAPRWASSRTWSSTSRGAAAASAAR